MARVGVEENIFEGEAVQRSRRAMVFFALAAAPMSNAHADFRLVGLERLYFEHQMGAEDLGAVKARVSQEVSEALPPLLSIPVFSDSDTQVPVDGPFQVDDVAIPLRDARHQRWIRQVSNRSHPRIFDVWWALYDDGRRTDVWHFSAMPPNKDSKALSNYFLQRIALNHDGRIVFEVSATMFRPDAWWITKKDFYFNVTDESIAFQRVANTYSFFYSYHAGQGQTGVKTERELDGRFEVRVVDSFSSDAARECRYHDPNEMVVADEPDMMTVAHCLTQRPETVVTFRDFASPSSIERTPCSDKGGNRTPGTKSC